MEGGGESFPHFSNKSSKFSSVMHSCMDSRRTPFEAKSIQSFCPSVIYCKIYVILLYVGFVGVVAMS